MRPPAPGATVAVTEEQGEAEHEGAVTLSIFAAGLRKQPPRSPLVGASSPAVRRRLRTPEREGVPFTRAHTPTAAARPRPRPRSGCRPLPHALQGAWAEEGERSWATVWREDPSRRRPPEREEAEALRRRATPSPPPRPLPEPFQPPSLFSFLPPGR